MIECSVLWYGGGLALVGVLLYIYINDALSYWQKRGVPCIKSKSTFEMVSDIITGKKSVSEVYEDVYNDLGTRGEKYGGVYQMFTPTLVVRDPEVIKRIMLKDFEHFHERVLYFKEDKDPLCANLFTVGGYRWRLQRTKLSPGFTPSKMKLMYEILHQMTHRLLTYIEDAGDVIEIKEMFCKFTMDGIATIAFGIETNCLKDPDSDFRKWGRKVFEATPLTGVRNFINFMMPKLAAIIYIPFFTKEVTDHFCSMVWNTIEYRRKNNIKRNDFMQMLMQLKDKGYIEDDETPLKPQSDVTETLSYNEIAAQAVIFFTAGFETTATALSFCMHELAMNPDVQEKLYNDLCTVLKKHNGEVTYDALQEIPYLDMVVSESLRKYPPGPIITRKCCKDFVLPGTDNIVLEEGTPVIIPVMGLHRDPKYFPEPDKFDPERFSESRKSTIPPYVYLPFGEGPRNCIAARFALMEMKLTVATILKEFVIQPCEKTVHPMTFEPRAFVLSSKDGMFFSFVKRNKHG